jgi:hypothetical protein
MKLTKAQRKSLFNVYNRTDKLLSYRQFRRSVQPGPGCIMVPYCAMWLGIEPDGHTHS